MIVSGYASHGLIFTALGYAGQEVPAYLNGFAEGAAVATVTVLELIIALGGLTVMLGGVAILFRRRSTGRALIFLGGGAGLIGLMISLGYTTFVLGAGRALAYAPYWVGLAMAVASRRLAKRA